MPEMREGATTPPPAPPTASGGPFGGVAAVMGASAAVMGASVGVLAEQTQKAAVDIAASGYTGHCRRLVRCNGILARDLCAPGAACAFSMTVNGSNQEACEAALQQVPAAVQALRPGYVLPGECR
jgi:hypothetical protein